MAASSRPQINRLLLPLTGLIADFLFPSARLAAKEKQTKPEFLWLNEALDRDALNIPTTEWVMARTAAECMRACDKVQASAGACTVPTLVVHSPADTMTDPILGSAAYVERCGADDKTLDLQTAVGMWHALTKEPGRDRVAERVIGWLGERCGGGGEAPRRRAATPARGSKGSARRRS